MCLCKAFLVCAMCDRTFTRFHIFLKCFCDILKTFKSKYWNITQKILYKNTPKIEMCEWACGQKNRCNSHFGLNKSATICQIWSILETNAKTLKKIVCFFGDLKQTKIAFEISWPLNSHFENVTWQIHRPLVRRQCVFLEFSHFLSDLLWYKMPKRCRKLLQFGPYAFST